MEDIDYILSFHHKGEFTKTMYVGGTCTVIPELVEADRFSYTVLMEYVKGNLNYTEIGGVYVKKVPNGWELIANDADLNEFVKAVGVKPVEAAGVNLKFYVDNVVDLSIAPVSQMQPHVTVRPRNLFFEGTISQMLFNLIIISHVDTDYLFFLSTDCTNRITRKASVCDNKRSAQSIGCKI